MLKSILDNDLYKFSMGYAYMKMYPDAEGVFEFHDRNNRQYCEYDIKQLKTFFKAWEELSLTNEEFVWAVNKMPYIPSIYWEWLRGFRFDSSKIKVWLDEEKHLHITAEDKLYKVTLYEVPILATVSELVNDSYVLDEATMMLKLEEKVKLSNDNKLIFSEFGTRRRFSFDVQDKVVKYLKEHAHYCTGTSNLYLAFKYDMTPIGTVAHEWVMFHGANFGYLRANYEAYEAWVKTFDGALGIALSDTYGTNAFLNNFSLKLAKLFDGVRQDSGDEHEFVIKVINRYKELGIDPLTKTIVFSNALNFPKFKEITEYCKGKIGKCVAGIGTNLTNDTGFKPSNIVMKLMRCRMNSKQPWLECIKISDDQGKVMGDLNQIKIANYQLNLGVENFMPDVKL